MIEILGIVCTIITIIGTLYSGLKYIKNKKIKREIYHIFKYYESEKIILPIRTIQYMLAQRKINITIDEIQHYCNIIYKERKYRYFYIYDNIYNVNVPNYEKFNVCYYFTMDENKDLINILMFKDARKRDILTYAEYFKYVNNYDKVGICTFDGKYYNVEYDDINKQIVCNEIKCY